MGALGETMPQTDSSSSGALLGSIVTPEQLVALHRPLSHLLQTLLLVVTLSCLLLWGTLHLAGSFLVKIIQGDSFLASKHLDYRKI